MPGEGAVSHLMVTLRRSFAGAHHEHKAILQGLGFTGCVPLSTHAHSLHAAELFCPPADGRSAADPVWAESVGVCQCQRRVSSTRAVH